MRNNLKNIKISKNEFRIKLNLVLYPEEYILKTAKKFSDICSFNIIENTEEENAITISLKPKDKSIDVKYAGYEFMNHVLSEIKNRA
ncbi:MAG: HxsD-like protein [Candidatus Altiarchaeota archaeon]